MDAINNLKKNKHPRKKYLLLVVRVHNNGTFKMSKCCSKCIEYITLNAKNKNYNINKILYSDVDGSITNTTLLNLQKDDKKYITRYYRN
jgi:hypothetical protein